MSGSLDTNILLRLIIGDVPAQTVLADELIEKATHQLGVADFVFVELEYALTKNYSFSKADTISFIRSTVAHPKLNCNRPLLFRALDKYEETSGVSFVDVCLGVYADLTDHTPLYTFDKNLAKKLPHSKLLV